MRIVDSLYFFQSQKMETIGLLAGGIAHDFRNQLTVIQGYGEMLAREEGLAERALDYVRQILAAADRSAELSGQLLAFSRQQELRPTVTNLGHVIAGLSKSLLRMVGEDIRLSVASSPGLGNVKTDVGQFQQAMVNLVVNARDAMPNGGQLTIETSNVNLDETFAKKHSDILPGPYVMTVVSDTGVGMDKQTLQHIFEPFFTTKPVGQGTGLGLPMVYGFVRQSGGHISVRSEPGHGTTFRIYLPRVCEPLTADARGEPQTALPKGVGTILVIEDESPIRAMVARTLRESGYTVLEASSAKDALPLGEHYDGRIDLLLCDVVMPDMSGPDIAAKVLAARPGMPVLYISGYTGKALANRGVLPSDVNLLVKPFSSRALVEAVLRLLGQTN
jgi:CheY-like chemotaxis protein